MTTFFTLLGILLALAFLPSVTSRQVLQAPASSDNSLQLVRFPDAVVNAKLEAVNGPSFSISDYSGKVLVINLFASWVQPSRLETPELEKLHKDFVAREVQVLGLSTEHPRDSRESLVRWISRYGLNYKIGWASPEVSTALLQGRDAVPQTYVISRTGCIVKRFVGFNPTRTAPLVRQAIEEALNEPAGSGCPDYQR